MLLFSLVFFAWTAIPAQRILFFLPHTHDDVFARAAPSIGRARRHMVLQKELLHSLLGHTGSVVVERDGGFELAAGMPLVDASEHALARRLLALGHCYRQLESFAAARLFGSSDAASSADLGGAYIVAFAVGLEECLQPYRARVLELEQHLLRSPNLSLPALQLGFGDFELTLPALRRLLLAVQHGNLRGVALLDHLHGAIAGCTHSLRACIRVLLRHTQRVLRAQLAAWLLHGELLPGDADFFIRRADGTSDGASGGGGGGGGGGSGGGSAADGGDVGWTAFEIIVSCKPASLPMRVAERILFIGKAVRVLRASEQRPLEPPRSLPIPAAAAGTSGAPGAPCGPLYASASGLPSPRLPSPRLPSPNSRASSPRVTMKGGRASAAPSPRSADVVSGVEGARERLDSAELALEAAELRQEQAAMAEVAAEAEALSILSSLTQPPGEQRTGDSDGDGGGGGGRGHAAEPPASDVITSHYGLADGRRACMEMRRHLEVAAAEMRALPLSDGAMQLEPLERLLSAMHRTTSRLLWRHLTVECGLLELLRAMKAYFLLGKGHIFHTLLEELRPLMGSHPPAHLDLQAALLHATTGEPPEPHMHSLLLSLPPPAPNASAYGAWCNLTLDLSVAWPLQLLMHAPSRARYAELFRFLLLVKRVAAPAPNSNPLPPPPARSVHSTLAHSITRHPAIARSRSAKPSAPAGSLTDKLSSSSSALDSLAMRAGAAGASVGLEHADAVVCHHEPDPDARGRHSRTVRSHASHSVTRDAASCGVAAEASGERGGQCCGSNLSRAFSQRPAACRAARASDAALAATRSHGLSREQSAVLLAGGCARGAVAGVHDGRRDVCGLRGADRRARGLPGRVARSVLPAGTRPKAAKLTCAPWLVWHGLGGGWSVVGRGCALGDESRPPLFELPVLPSRAGFICLDRPPPDFPAVPLPLPHALIRREGRTGRDHLPGAVCHRLARVQQAVSLPLRLPIQHVLAAAVAALCVPPQRSSLAPNIPLPCAHALVPAGSVRQHTRWSLPGPYASTRALARSYGKRVNAPHTLCICMLSRRRASHPCSHIRSSSARSLPSWQWPSCYSASTTTPFSARARGPRLERHRGQHEQPQCRTQPTTVSRGLTLREPPRRHFLCKA